MTGGASGISRGVWTLGFVSLLMDTSSELIHALLPLYMVGVLGASVLTVGIIEGVAEAIAMIVKVFSGDCVRRSAHRKPLVLLGYGLAAVSKLAFPLAPTLAWVVGARFADRVGKGIRGAPRDALIADLTPRRMRGAASACGRRSTRSARSRARCWRWRDGVFRRRISARRSGSPSSRRRCAWSLLVFGVDEPDERAHPRRRRVGPALRRREAAAGLVLRSSSPSRAC